MGVPLLWGELTDAAQYNTLLGLSIEAFERQPRVRAVRLGCDASIWLFVSLVISCRSSRGSHTILYYSTLARWQQPAWK
jgi:hypothetical protein